MVTTLAYVLRDEGGKQVMKKEKVSLPIRDSNQVLVKINYVAQNPTDVQSLDAGAFDDGTVLGCDFVGVVEDSGSSNRWNKGDHVAGLVWGGEVQGLGAYGTYCYADERISFKVPQNIEGFAAATIPLASCTAWLALFSKNCLAIPRDGKSKVLIWGGSSSVGLYAIQIARMVGFEVITTCSPHNFDLVKELGADHVFDYSKDGIVDEIGQLKPEYAFDTIGNQNSSTLSSKAIGHGTLCTVRPGKANTENVQAGVKVADVLVWTAFLKDHAYKEFKFPASQADHELCTELFEKLPDWLETGVIKPNRAKVFDSLDSIHEGFDMYRKGKISSTKIVYRV